MQSLEEISGILSIMDKKEITDFFKELLTSSEIRTLSKRWQVVKMLATTECTQREVARSLHVSLCIVTHGAKILKIPNATVKRYIKGDIYGIKHSTNN